MKVLPLLLVLICSTSLFGQYDIRLGSTEVLADSGVSISNLSVEVQSTQPGIELTGYQMLFSYDEDLIHILGADSTIDPIEPEFFNVYVSNFPAPGLPAGVCRIGSIFSFQIDTFVPTPPGDWVPLYDLLVATTPNATSTVVTDFVFQDGLQAVGIANTNEMAAVPAGGGGAFNAGLTQLPYTLPLSFVDGVPFARGDVDGSGSVQIVDAIESLEWMFLSGPDPACMAAMDFNEDSSISLTDPIALLTFLFLSGPGNVDCVPQDPQGISCDQPTSCAP